MTPTTATVRLLLLALVITSSSTCTALEVGQPVVRPQYATVQGTRIKAADVEVPLVFEADETEELFLLSEGFVCPGQSSSMSCSSSASSSCVCDYASMTSCTQLPSCCEAEDSEVWSTACSDDGTASPADWVVLGDGEPVTLTAPAIRGSEVNEPIYLRYHPSSDASCQGFGLSVLAPFDEEGEVLSLATTVVYYVSWTNARPQTDPNATVLTARPGQSSTVGRPRFCPSHDQDSAQTNGFFGASNDRTAFIAMFSETSNAALQNVPGLVTITLYETPDVSSITTLSSVDNDETGYAPLTDQQTVVVAAGQLSSKFSFTHTATSCANLVVDAHSNSASATTSMTGDYSAGYVRWSQTGFSSASSLVVNICPQETFHFEVTTAVATTSSSPAATLTLVTAYLQPAIDLLSINEVNPNLFGPLLAGASAARLLCHTNDQVTLAEEHPMIFTNDEQRYVSTCYGSYLKSTTPYCQFYPVANRENATMLWPAGPTTILAAQSYSQFVASEMAATIGDVVSSSLRFTVILEQVIFQDSYLGSVESWTFRTWEELSSCRVDFGATLITSNGDRLDAETPTLGSFNESACDPNGYKKDQEMLEKTAKSYTGETFRQLSSIEQRTKLLLEAQLGLIGDFSECNYVPQDVYLIPYTEITNCSDKDPCCPTADQFISYFYSYCINDSYARIRPEVDYFAIDADGGDYQCSSTLSYEASTSEMYIATGASAFDDVACSFGQDDIDYLDSQLKEYYQLCRTSIAGAFDMGVPCATVDDCPSHPQMACLPVASSNVYNSAQSSPYRRSKMCQAPTSVFDDLMLDCLVSSLPVLVNVTLTEEFESLGYTESSFTENLRQYLQLAGCAATGPSFLQTHAATTELRLNEFNPAGQTYNSCYNTGTCPYPVNCVDTLCELSQGCSYPWGCAVDFTSYTNGTSQGTCTESYRCNFVSPGATTPTECTGTEATCQSRCKSLVGGDDGFCGYCDDASGYCYVATDADNVLLTQDQCNTIATSSTSDDDKTCWIQDLGMLVGGQGCNGLGSCTHFADSASSTTAVLAEECGNAPGLCLTDERSIMFPQVAGCMGVIETNSQGCAESDAQLTDSGCLYSLSVFPNEASCIGATDPVEVTQVMKGWVNVVDTEDECTGTEAMFVCNLDASDTSPLSNVPNLNSRSMCESRGGTFESPYVWEQPTFNAGVGVPLTWMSVEAVAAGSWTQRISYVKFANVLTAITDQLQLNSDVLTARCVYSNVLTVSALSAACQDVYEEAEYRDSCSSVVDVRDKPAPTQQLGKQTLCDNAQIGDYITYPSQYNIPPVSITLTDTSQLTSANPYLMPGCAEINASMKSNAKFQQPRRRIRETSFFLTRQDVHIAELSTLSSSLVANGFILSDAVKLQTDDTHFADAWMCIQVRPDFLTIVADMYSNHSSSFSSSSSFYLGFGTLDEWSVLPIASTQDGIMSSYLTDDGELYSDVVGHRFPSNQSLTELTSVCRFFTNLEVDRGQASFYAVVLTFNEDPENVPNGFDTAQTVWLYITACVYIAPVLVLWLPLVFRSVYLKKSLLAVPMIATFFLSLFLVFRSTLLFGLAAGTITESSTTEFALTDIAVWCEFAAVCLLGLVITVAVTSSEKMKTNKGFSSSHTQQALFLFLVLLLVSVFVAFVIAYSQTGNSSSGVTNPDITCAGREPAGVTLWTTRRILRLSYECLLAVMGLLIGAWLVWISWSIRQRAQGSATGTQLYRLTVSTVMLAVMILSHAIIALILIGTEWTNFIFGIIMLYVTELLPLCAFFILSLWKNITEFTSLSWSWTRSATASSNGRRSASPTTTTTREE